MNAATSLRKRLLQPEILLIPGGGSPLELRLIEQTGFEAAYVSGYATAAARYGEPDIGLCAYAEIEDAVHAMRRVTNLPLIVDCDTGYGDVANVVRTVRGMELLGVAAIQLEDQAWPKRCGHMDNKIVESRDVAVRKIRAAVAARQNPDTLIVARTDSRGPMGIHEALDRCLLFKEAGADILFVDGPQSLEELEQIGRELPGPLLANMSETGLTPLRSASELQEMGYKIALFPSSTVRLMIKAVGDFLEDLRKTGDSRAWVDKMASLGQTNTALGLDEIRAFESKLLSGK
ncbi:MAG: isocitrate lyase/phosphoenolpyruvate mutase family protein [Burkholderiaceae bacterium]|nr:isocitrate lyase/phosphoenolpyruvate mutase family protein [Burkholderiaceae bacterium]